MTEAPHPDDSWESFSSRLAADLRELTDDSWITLATCTAPRPAESSASARPSRTWRRLLGRDSSAAPDPVGDVPEAFLQVRLLAGLIALECIADTEFEGLSDLSEDQVRQLVELGWELVDDGPDLSRTFAPEGTTEAAALLAATLRDILGAASPTDVDLRRSP